MHRFMILSFSFFIASFPLFSDEGALITASAEGHVEVPAEAFSVIIGVETRAASPKKALEENTKRMERVIETLETLQFDKDAYQTGSFSIRPILNEKKQIETYQVTNQMRLYSDKLSRLPDLFEKLSENEATHIQNLQYTVKSVETHRYKAIENGVKHALEQAKQMAEAADLEFKSIETLVLDQASIQTKTPSLLFSKAGGPPPLAPGFIKIEARVTVQIRAES